MADAVLLISWVKTGMGEGIADALGIKEGGPGMTATDSAKALLEQVSLPGILSLGFHYE